MTSVRLLDMYNIMNTQRGGGHDNHEISPIIRHVYYNEYTNGGHDNHDINFQILIAG